MGRPYLIKSDFSIPENTPVFYFEVRIENEGKDGYNIFYVYIFIYFIFIYYMINLIF